MNHVTIAQKIAADKARRRRVAAAVAKARTANEEAWLQHIEEVLRIVRGTPRRDLIDLDREEV